MQCLSVTQSTHIMQSSVKGMTSALVALHTTARLPVGLQYEDTTARFREQQGTCQSTETTSYDDNIISHSFRLLIHLKIAGCST